MVLRTFCELESILWGCVFRGVVYGVLERESIYHWGAR